MNPNEEYIPMKDPKYCFIPSCKNNSKDSQKKFFVVPTSNKKEWCKAVCISCPKRVVYICEDHLNLEQDLENYRYWITMKGRPKLKTRLPQSLKSLTVGPQSKLKKISLLEPSKSSISPISTMNEKKTHTPISKGVQTKPKTCDKTTHGAFLKTKTTSTVEDNQMSEGALPSTQENSSLKSNNDESSITSPDTRSAVTLHVEGYSKSINDGCNIKSHDSRSILPIIAKVYIFLEREYEYMKTLNGDNCDISPLADVLKRTAGATGFSEDDVVMVMEKEGLADHLPGRARRKRKKRLWDCGLEHEEVLKRDNLDVTVEKKTTGQAAISSEDDEMIERENLNIMVKKETTDNAGYGHEALSSAPAYVFLTSDIEQTQVKTQVKVEPEDNEDVTSHHAFHEITPLQSNDEYFNQDEDDKMDIEQYTFTGTRSNDPPNPTASVSEYAEIKIEPADD